MKIGLSTWSLLHKDLYSAIEAIGNEGYDYVELWGEVPHAYPEWADKKRVLDALSSYKMTVTTHAPFSDLNPGWPYQPVKDSIERTLESFVDFSDSVGATIVTFHPGTTYTKFLVEDSFEASTATLKRMVKAAGGRLAIDVENQTKGMHAYDFPVASSAENIERMLTEVDGLQFTLDTGHAHVSEINPDSFARKAGPKLKELHLSDNTGKADDHLIPGQGTAELNRLLKRLAPSDVLVCLELNPFKNSEAEVLRAGRELKAGLGLS